MKTVNAVDQGTLEALYAATAQRVQAGTPKWKIEAELTEQGHDAETIRTLMGRLDVVRG